MKEFNLGEIEARFAEIIWQGAPIASAELTRLALQELGWKKSTAYTVLKRLCDKGIFINDGGVVRTVISKEDFYSMQSERFIEQNFKGSLPAFIAAFTSRKKLSAKEIRLLREMVDSFEEE